MVWYAGTYCAWARHFTPPPAPAHCSWHIICLVHHDVTVIDCQQKTYQSSMVLTEIPLWVTHGSAGSNAEGTLLVSGGGGGDGLPKSKAPPTNGDDTTKDDLLVAAKSAISLLQSTSGGGGGAHYRAPMYSVDIHPDGTRFATAGGDGSVKIWSVGSLFGGRKLFSPRDATRDGEEDGGEKQKRRRRGGATCRFLEDGNFVSSNSEGYDTATTANSSSGGGRRVQQTTPSTAPAAATTALPMTYDLSGLVRRKKVGATAAEAGRAASATSFNPFASNATPSYSDSPLSKLTQRISHNNDDSNNNKGDAQSLHNNNSQQLHKLLTTISSHQGSVLALRFSPSGKYLATAGDDSYVNIYVRSNTPSLANKGNLVGVGAKGGRKQEIEEDVEHWNRIALCRGHQLDVVGLAWAPDDSHLVSCSLDSVHPVIVWRLFDVLGGGKKKSSSGGGGDGGDFGPHSHSGSSSSVYMHNLHPFKVLGRNIHKSTVKGVAFDPAGKFIASSGDDPAICIWRASDDWGLEARIDATSGVFKSKKRKIKGSSSGGNSRGDYNNDDDEEDDPGELASLSMFRRISFAPDGSHICGTNASLKGKNIAAMISREGWAASGPNPKGGGESQHHPPGAANLVGHKQPVVSSRHCPVFFQVPSSKRKRPPSAFEEDASSDSESDDDYPDCEPQYSTLVALGDKRGFVTVWSTKSSRPLFKMQCSESRCTVTDISWGVVRSSSKGGGDDNNDSLIMIVSLLDGFVVALHFSIPTEVGGGRLLSAEKTKRIFRVKYGIDDGGDGRRLVDDSGPALIENALQFTMEMDAADSASEASKTSAQREQHNVSHFNNTANIGGSILDKQVVTTKQGKKRIAPVLLSADGGTSLVNSISDEDGKRNRNKNSKISNDQSSDPLQNALNAAEAAAAAAEGVSSHVTNVEGINASREVDQQAKTVSVTEGKFSGGEVRIPYNTTKVLSADLVIKSSSASDVFDTSERNKKVVADCVNSAPVSTGVSSWPFVTLSISRGGVREWKDIITKTTCTSIAANDRILALGTANGCLYLYGTSPTLGWESGKAFRAFPPFVLGSPVVAINVTDVVSGECEIVVVTSDGAFSVYKLLESGPKLEYKGSIVPPMQHMILSSTLANQRSVGQPKLVRIQITDSKRLMLVLMLPALSAGRALEGFVYNRGMESWMLVADSNNFLLSDFYAPIHKPNLSKEGILSRIDKIVTSSASTMASAKQMYQRVVENEKHSYQYIMTRSHCEDRLACSIALDSKSEFETWLALYSRCLSTSGEAEALRFLVDTLLDDVNSNTGDFMGEESGQNVPSFLSIGIKSLGLESKQIIRQLILPEMSKNRHLQRLTNEISIELDNL